MKYRELSYVSGTPVSAASGSLGAGIIPFRETWRSRLLVVLALAVMTLGIVTPSYGQGTNVFNCPSGFATSGSCGLSTDSGTQAFWSGNAVVGSQVPLVPSGLTHQGNAMNYQKQVNVQAFATTFRFVPDGWTFAFVLQNNTNSGAGNASGGACTGTKCTFSAGAGCEGGFYQAFDTNDIPPNNIFALDLSSYDYLTTTAPFGDFTYSSVQIYQMAESPCLPNDDQSSYFGSNKISTSPVPLTSPVNSMNSYTGDTYSVALNYTGTNLVMNMYDVTAGGSCPGTSCFSYTWNGVDIPSLVGSTTAYVGLTAGTGDAATTTALYVDSFVYTVLSPAATPTLSPVSANQTVTISDGSSDAIICYNTTGAPATNGTTGCTNGTLYSGAIAVTSGQTIFAVAGGTGYGDSPIGSAAYQISSTTAQPIFSLGTAKYQGDQTLTISDATPSSTIYYTTNGSTPTTSSSVYSAPIPVSATQTVNAIAAASGASQSTVGSVTLTINPYAGAAPANSPTYSPLPGSYASEQSVKLSSSTSGSYICYTLASSPPTLLPQPNNEGGCIVGTLYSGPITVSSTSTLYAMASTNRTGPPSSLTVGVYTIGGTQAPGTPSNVQFTVTHQ